MNVTPEWLQWAQQLQAIAQTGLTFVFSITIAILTGQPISIDA